MKVSILISGYNSKKDIFMLLDSIENLVLNGCELEVILRDDNSSDGTFDAVSQKYPRVHLIKGDHKIGFVKSNNMMFKKAAGKVICCINQDVILNSKFILEGIAAM